MNLQLLQIQEQMPPKASCFRHPDRPAVKVIAGDGFCEACWTQDSLEARPPRPKLDAPKVRSWGDGALAKLAGRPRGTAYRPTQFKPLMKVDTWKQLVAATAPLSTKDKAGRPILLRYRERRPLGMSRSAHQYAKRFHMKYSVRRTELGLLVWRIA